MNTLTQLTDKISLRRKLSRQLAWIVALVWLTCWYLTEGPKIAVTRSWKASVKLTHTLLGRWRLWRQFVAWCRLSMVQRCDRKKHMIQGTIMPSGKPGKMCPICGYVVEVSRKEFKTLFGISPETAIRRAQNRGHHVSYAERYGS